MNVTRQHNRKWTPFLILAIILMFMVNISLGSVTIPLDEIFKILTGQGSHNRSWESIVLNFRLPKALTAAMVGAGLSVSGLQMQTLFRNPLAGPFVLGISSGASLGVAILMLSGLTMLGSLAVVSNWMVAIAAAAGSFLVLLLVVAVSLRVQDSMALLIIGIMFGSLTSAIVSLLQFFSSGEDIQLFLFWTFGSLGGLNWNELVIAGIITLTGLLLSFFLIKPLNALLLSENYASSMGVDVKRSRLWIILSTSLLAGGITAFCGPIAFIGLAVPHLCRLLFNSSDHKVLMPVVIMVGISIMLVCDLIAQLPGSAHVLPINAITSLLGAPVVIWIIMKRKQLRQSF